MIACKDACIYQQEGICTLDHITAPSEQLSPSGCIHYVPLQSGKSKTAEKICAEKSTSGQTAV